MNTIMGAFLVESKQKIKIKKCGQQKRREVYNLFDNIKLFHFEWKNFN